MDDCIRKQKLSQLLLRPFQMGFRSVTPSATLSMFHAANSRPVDMKSRLHILQSVPSRRSIR